MVFYEILNLNQKFPHYCNLDTIAAVFVIFLLSHSNFNFETGCTQGSLLTSTKLLKYESERAYTDQNTKCITYRTLKLIDFNNKVNFTSSAEGLVKNKLICNSLEISQRV